MCILALGRPTIKQLTNFSPRLTSSTIKKLTNNLHRSSPTI